MAAVVAGLFSQEAGADAEFDFSSGFRVPGSGFRVPGCGFRGAGYKRVHDKIILILMKNGKPKAVSISIRGTDPRRKTENGKRYKLTALLFQDMFNHPGALRGLIGKTESRRGPAAVSGDETCNEPLLR
jgi:hypothetical protein